MDGAEVERVLGERLGVSRSLRLGPTTGDPGSDSDPRDSTSPATTSETIVVEVEVRGATERLRWTRRELTGDAGALERLRRFGTEDLGDPVAFLRAVRTAFGPRFSTHMDPITTSTP